MITQEMPGMSPRAIAPNASRALEAAGASQTTRSAGAPTASVPLAAARRNPPAFAPAARPRRARKLQNVERRAEVAARHDLQAHVGLADDRREAARVERRGPA